MKKGDKISLRLLVRGYIKERKKEDLKTVKFNYYFFKNNPNNPTVRLSKQASKIVNKLNEILKDEKNYNKRKELKKEIITEYIGISYYESIVEHHYISSILYTMNNKKERKYGIRYFLLSLFGIERILEEKEFINSAIIKK